MIGVLPVDKPAGPTSHDVVATARRRLDIRRIGHTGTLDPFATGLLLLCIGSATRIAEYLQNLPKSYTARMRLGVRTSTDDPEGEVVATSDAWRELEAAEVTAAFRRLQGTGSQVPPIYSAKWVGGERMHRRARAGEPVTAEPVEVTIHEIAVEELALPHVVFRVTCSSGTYIRAIARDVGAALGTGAHLVALRRTRIGTHHVEAAVELDRLDDAAAVERALLSPLEALDHLPRVHVSGERARWIAHGTPVAAADAPTGGPVAVEAEGRLLAIARVEGGRLKPKKVLDA